MVDPSNASLSMPVIGDLSCAGTDLSPAQNTKGIKLELLHTSPFMRVGADKVSRVPGAVAEWLFLLGEGSCASGPARYEHEGSERTKCS